jgi:hypothetical protein
MNCCEKISLVCKETRSRLELTSIVLDVGQT